MGRSRVIETRVVRFLQSNGGVVEINQNKAKKQLHCHPGDIGRALHILEQERRIQLYSPAKTGRNGVGTVWMLSGEVNRLAKLIVGYLQKYTDPAPINAKQFSQKHGFDLRVFNIALSRLTEHKMVVKINEGATGIPPDYAVDNDLVGEEIMKKFFPVPDKDGEDEIIDELHSEPVTGVRGKLDKMIITFLREKGGQSVLNQSELAKTWLCNPSSIYQRIKELIANGIITKVGTSRSEFSHGRPVNEYKLVEPNFEQPTDLLGLVRSLKAELASARAEIKSLKDERAAFMAELTSA